MHAARCTIKHINAQASNEHYNTYQCATVQYNTITVYISTYLLILGYFIFQRALQTNRFAFELIKGLRHIYSAFVIVVGIVAFVVATYRCAVVNVDVAVVTGRRRRCRHGPTMTEGSVKGRNVGVFFFVACCLLCFCFC
jgi:hypothetical protein